MNQSDTVPAWLPWAEVAFSIPACVICMILIIALVTVPLPNACKVFLYTNTFSLFSLALCQALIAEWTSRNRRGIGPQELYYFPLIFAHQALYLLSTASLFYLTCERLFLCFRPTFYEVHKWRMASCLAVAAAIEIILITPPLLMLQYGETRDLSQLLSTAILIITLLLLFICYRQSRVFYSAHFANVNLNVRYQVKEVIELTRVLIPVCTMSLVFQLSIEVLAKFVFTDPSYIGTAVLILRTVSTTTAYIEPILLMLRHRSISRKISTWIYPGRIWPTIVRVETSIEDMTHSYFSSLQRDWS